MRDFLKMVQVWALGYLIYALVTLALGTLALGMILAFRIMAATPPTYGGW